ncbi:helix-turn-helix domain-containing protein [Nocardia sp. GP40]|uniref:helix-turn-helix domain-containing protein n=1 Tax=Nocardia sp. GP40 TaxID=3156268 RepID=UPI003D196F12
MAAALSYIAAHLGEPLSVATVAAQANLSTSAFSQLFRQVTGRSPWQFVKEMRLNRARDLLLEPRRARGTRLRNSFTRAAAGTEPAARFCTAITSSTARRFWQRWHARMDEVGTC